MKFKLHPRRSSHELVAFFEFFASAGVIAFGLYQLLRFALPADWLFEYGGIIGTLSFLAATGICAWWFERASQHQQHR